MKERIKKLPGFLLLRWLYHLPRQAYHGLRYSWVEYRHRTSVARSRQMGVTETKRNPELIVSLTSIPERIGKISLCLDSLLRQSLTPDRLILWLSESNEAGRPQITKQSLPPDLLRLVKRGLDIQWCDDIRSFTKIIPTLRAYPNALIVTADDDIFYPRDWLKSLYDAYQREPQYIHCHRAHRIKYNPTSVPLPYRQWEWFAPGYQGPSFDLFPTSVGGVLYAPGHLHPEVLNESAFLSLCPKADDVWLKAMAHMANVSCKKVKPASLLIMEIRIPNNRTLWSENVTLDGNDPQIKAVAERYGVFRKDV